MEVERGPPKKKLKKASTSNIETSIVVTAPASGMVFPHNEAVTNAIHKKRKRKASSSAGVNKGKAPPTTTRSGNTVSSMSIAGSNDPFPLAIEHPSTGHQDTRSCEASLHTVQPLRKKRAAMKKLTPKRAPVETANPSSPASNTRSKKKLQLE